MADRRKKGLIDLSHVIEEGMMTYKDLPGPDLCCYWTREASADNYDDGSTFQIGRIDMVAKWLPLLGGAAQGQWHGYLPGARFG
jgi:arylformamidase